MQNIELRDESPSTPFEPEGVRKKRRNPLAKKAALALADVPKELRKREAAEPLYLVRYE